MPKPTAKTAAKTAPRARRTRTDVQEEFEEIQEQVQSARESADAKAQATARHEENEIRRAVEGIAVEGVVEQMSKLGLEISRTLGGVSEKLVGEIERLASVREAVEIERKELERLHQIDVAATALDQLVGDYEAKQSELEKEIAGHRAVWEENTANTERERKEQDEALRKQRQRDIDEYEYKKGLERKRAQDKYDEEVSRQEKKNAEKQETLEKSWAQREAAIREQEDELARLRKEAADFPARLQREVQQASAAAAKTANQQAEQTALIARKEAEAEQRMAELRIKTLEDVTTRQNAQIADMQKQVDDAKRQVQEIALRAIEGASGSRTLAHVNEIAMEQAKHRGQQS